MASTAYDDVNIFCETHPNKSVQFVCLDPRCSKPTRACVICIKNDHNKCKDDYILLSREIEDKVDLIKPSTNNKQLVQKLNEILELKFYELNKTLNNKKQVFIQSLKADQDVSGLIAPGVLENVKKNYKVEYDQAGDRILISSKFDVENDVLEQSYKSFEKNVEKKVLNFIKDFEKLKFSVKGKLNADDWIKHKNIEIEDDSNGLLFKRGTEDSSFNYFVALYTIPLDVPCKYKITIQSIYESDRFLDFGIMGKSKFESSQSDFVNSFGSGGISYCGYSYTGGLNGKALTSSSTDSTGFKPGDHCIMEYTPGETIRFYNEEETLDMSLSMSSNTDTYYLFLVLYHPQASCILENIN